jgi:hypothetical protein
MPRCGGALRIDYRLRMIDYCCGDSSLHFVALRMTDGGRQRAEDGRQRAEGISNIEQGMSNDEVKRQRKKREK